MAYCGHELRTRLPTTPFCDNATGKGAVMTQTANPLERWLTGVSAGTDEQPRQVVVSQRPDLIDSMLDAGLIVQGADVYVENGPLTVPTSADLRMGVGSFRGSFTSASSLIQLSDGLELRSRPYGAAEFLCLDSPTILWIENSDDLSAYLRDADIAWSTGRFAEHLTHPNAIVANLAAVGGAADLAGPASRLFVFPDGGISTSPTGRQLGWHDSGLADIDDRWRSANAASRHPDAICLDRVVADRDRTDALAERPWIGRYVVVAGVLRGIRARARQPSAVSGFGNRFAAGLPPPEQPDPLNDPVLVRLGSVVIAVDPLDGSWTQLSKQASGALEALLALRTPAEVQRWCARDDPGADDRAVHMAIVQLDGAGVARHWCAEVAQQWTNPRPDNRRR